MTDFFSCGSFASSLCGFLSVTLSPWVSGHASKHQGRVFPGTSVPLNSCHLSPPGPHHEKHTTHTCSETQSKSVLSSLQPLTFRGHEERHVLTEVMGGLGWGQCLVWEGLLRLDSAATVQLWDYLQGRQMCYSQSPPQDELRQQTHMWMSCHCLQEVANGDNLKHHLWPCL